MVVKRPSFATLIKLQKTYVDEQRQVLARLQENLNHIEEQFAQLEIMKAREQDAAQDMATRATYGAFLQGVVIRERALEKERHVAALAVQGAQDKLSVLFEDQKRYETAEAMRLEEKAREERRLETIELDEAGSVMHERKKE